MYKAMYKDSSSTTKVHAVLDTLAPSSSGISLNNKLLVGPTVHSSLVDVLICFHLHCIALSTNVSHMYLMIQLEEFGKATDLIYVEERCCGAAL